MNSLQELESDLLQLLQGYDAGRPFIEGVTLILLGPANAGKSSLLNRLMGQDRSIVTATPGTTRDIVDGQIRLGPLPVRILDTAGLRPSRDPIEREGVRRAIRGAGDADGIMVVIDGSRPLERLDRTILRRVMASGKPVLPISTKGDLGLPYPAAEVEAITGRRAIVTSALMGQGFDELTRAAVELFGGTPPSSGDVLVTNARQRDCISRALAILREAMEVAGQGAALDLLATCLREAVASLGEVLGEVTTDQILDTIFSRFCIGK